MLGLVAIHPLPSPICFRTMFPVLMVPSNHQPSVPKPWQPCDPRVLLPSAGQRRVSARPVPRQRKALGWRAKIIARYVENPDVWKFADDSHQFLGCLNHCHVWLPPSNSGNVTWGVPVGTPTPWTSSAWDHPKMKKNNGNTLVETTIPSDFWGKPK